MLIRVVQGLMRRFGNTAHASSSSAIPPPLLDEGAAARDENEEEDDDDDEGESEEEEVREVLASVCDRMVRPVRGYADTMRYIVSGDMRPLGLACRESVCLDDLVYLADRCEVDLGSATGSSLLAFIATKTTLAATTPSEGWREIHVFYIRWWSYTHTAERRDTPVYGMVRNAVHAWITHATRSKDEWRQRWEELRAAAEAAVSAVDRMWALAAIPPVCPGAHEDDSDSDSEDEEDEEEDEEEHDDTDIDPATGDRIRWFPVSMRTLPLPWIVVTRAERLPSDGGGALPNPIKDPYRRMYVPQSSPENAPFFEFVRMHMKLPDATVAALAASGEGGEEEEDDDDDEDEDEDRDAATVSFLATCDRRWRYTSEWVPCFMVCMWKDTVRCVCTDDGLDPSAVLAAFASYVDIVRTDTRGWLETQGLRMRHIADTAMAHSIPHTK